LSTGFSRFKLEPLTPAASSSEIDDLSPEATGRPDAYPLGVGDIAALKHLRTVDQGVMPLPYGDAFNLFSSQLYIPLIPPNGVPVGVLCDLAGIHDFFTPELRGAYETLARDCAPIVAHALRPEATDRTII
jgi:hypothetical protein